MVTDVFYQTFYLVVISILTMILSIQYGGYSNSRLSAKPTGKLYGVVILSVMVAAYLGFRPYSYRFIDMMNYYLWYINSNIHDFHFNSDTGNLIFDNLYNYMIASGADPRAFFVIIAAVYIGGISVACTKLFPKDAFYAIIIYLAAFSTFSYGTNGIKAGAAASVFLCAIAYRRHLLKCIVFLALSIGLHHSMYVPVLAFVICYFYKKPKIYLIMWLACFVISAMHITFFQELFSGVAGDESTSSYLSIGEEGYYSGFRIDFILYSSAPVFLGYYCMKRGYESSNYNFIWCLYVLVNSVWMLCMYASFTNRIAYLSWLMLPIVLIYPYFDKAFIPHQYRELNKVAWGHLLFTLFMTFIYY